MHTQAIPPELLDLIVDHLHGDKQSLLACSLVPGLIQTSRYHLFSDLHIQPCTSSIFGLLDLVSSPLNTIAPYTRCLVFDNMTKLVYHHPVSDVTRAVRNLPRLASFLPHLHSLRLSNTDFDRVPSEILGQLVYMLRGVAEIELHAVHFSRFSEMVDVLCAFVGLKRASLSRVSWTHGGYIPTKLRRPSPCVEWHIGCGALGEDFAQWLIRQEVPPNVKSLSLNLVQSKSSATHTLLHLAAASITDLHLQLPANDFNNAESSEFAAFVILMASI